jgi:hypothetical protein
LAPNPVIISGQVPTTSDEYRLEIIMTDSSSPMGKAFKVTEQTSEQATPTRNLAKGIDDESESEMLLAPTQAALIQELEA